MKNAFGEALKWVKDHKYCYAMLYLVFYVIVFFTLDFLITPKYMIHCFIDDLIPLCEYFVVFYFSWIPGFVIMLAFYMFHNKYDFQQLWFIMFVGMTFCLITYVVVPNGLELRMEPTRDNIFSSLLKLIWTADAAVNVCPSIHCSSSLSIVLVTLRSGYFKGKPVKKGLIVAWMFLISFSTLFVKQHSVIDVVCGYAVTIVLYFIAYYTDWRKLLEKNCLKVLL